VADSPACSGQDKGFLFGHFGPLLSGAKLRVLPGDCKCRPVRRPGSDDISKA
jgi:hypothetical protein